MREDTTQLMMGLVEEGTTEARHSLGQPGEVGSTSRVPLENPPPTPRTPSTLGFLPNNVRRRLSSPGPSRFLSPLTVPQRRLGGELGVQYGLARGREEQQGEVGQKTNTRKHIVLWCPRLRKIDGALCIEGHLLDENMVISEQPVYSTRVMVAKASHIRVHGRTGTEYILEGKVVAKETSFPDIFHSTSNTPVLLLNKFERGFPDNWTELRNNWNVYARRQEEVPALIPELEQATEGHVDKSTPYNEAASGERHRRVNRRESGLHQAQLAAILERREHAKSSKVTERKKTERSSQGFRAASKRRRSPSVPTRKSPRLEKQVEGDGNSEKEGHQMILHGADSAERGRKLKKVAAEVVVNDQQSSLQCTKCQFKTQSKYNFERHMVSKNHKNKVALEVVVPSKATSDTQSKAEAGEEVEKTAGGQVDGLQHSSTGAKGKGAGETGSKEDTESVRTTNSSTGATVSQEVIASGALPKESNCSVTMSQEENALGGVPTFNRLKNRRASATEARARCASMLKE